MPRPYFAAGVGKSTEDAIGRLLMTAEAADNQRQEVACIVVDVDKCYENVDHDKLRAAAIKHGFPLAIVRLCLDIYRASSRLCWEGVTSMAMHANRTLVPRCSVAL